MRGLTAIYTVTPKAKLLSLEFPTDDLRKFVEATQLLANDEGGLSGFSDEIWLDMVKKVVFSYFLSFEDLDKVLGSPMLSTNKFDEYWSIQRNWLDGNLVHFSKYAKRVSPQRFVSFGNEDIDRITKEMIGWE